MRYHQSSATVTRGPDGAANATIILSLVCLWTTIPASTMNFNDWPFGCKPIFIETILYYGAVFALISHVISQARLAEQGQKYGCEQGAGHWVSIFRERYAY